MLLNFFDLSKRTQRTEIYLFTPKMYAVARGPKPRTENPVWVFCGGGRNPINELSPAAPWM